MSLGALGRGSWVKCEIPVVEKLRSPKKRNAHKNEELTYFPCIKSDSPARRLVCAFADVFGDIGKGGVHQMQDGGYGEWENWRQCTGRKIINISPI